ncbi:MAG: hypothetical protein ACRD51_00810, partial [Candidatus Acidiferrum sp.]
TILCESYNLSNSDVTWIRNVAQGREMFCLNSSFDGEGYFKTWFGEFSVPINLPVRVFVDLRDLP